MIKKKDFRDSLEESIKLSASSANIGISIFYIYILECINDSYYTGYTTDIKRRFQEHSRGTKSCKYTRSFPPKRLAVCWKISVSLSLVLNIERFIKALPKSKKQILVNDPCQLINFLQANNFPEDKLEKILPYSFSNSLPVREKNQKI